MENGHVIISNKNKNKMTETKNKVEFLDTVKLYGEAMAEQYFANNPRTRSLLIIAHDDDESVCAMIGTGETITASIIGCMENNDDFAKVQRIVTMYQAHEAAKRLKQRISDSDFNIDMSKFTDNDDD